LTGFLLDTNVCVRLLNPNKNKRIAIKLESVDSASVFLSSITRAELYYGAYRSSRRDENLLRLEAFLDAFAILPFNEHCERIYGQIRAELAAQGQLIGPNDLLIAATALAHGMTLVTHNIREFCRLRDLRIEDWEQ
jgi:tRNA(fMet)-specific endonuclease VapC